MVSEIEHNASFTAADTSHLTSHALASLSTLALRTTMSPSPGPSSSPSPSLSLSPARSRSLSRATGAIVGAFAGDAAGAVLEFGGVVTAVAARRAMTMPGGGVFRVGPGQITDDSELALCLARALVVARAPPAATSGASTNTSSSHSPPPADAPFSAGGSASRGAEPAAAEPGSGGAAGAARGGYWEGGFPLGRVARAYHWWGFSRPFDMGNTCATAFRFPHPPPPGGGFVSSSFSPYSSAEQAKTEKLEWQMAKQMQTNAATCMNSQANGALMRVTPLAVWAHRLPPHAVAQCAALDASLSHTNPTCRAASSAYCIAIAHLINNPGDAQGAFEEAVAWAAGERKRGGEMWAVGGGKKGGAETVGEWLEHVRVAVAAEGGGEGSGAASGAGAAAGRGSAGSGVQGRQGGRGSVGGWGKQALQQVMGALGAGGRGKAGEAGKGGEQGEEKGVEHGGEGPQACVTDTQGNDTSKQTGGKGCVLQVECTQFIGWVKWGFLLAFYHLLRRSSYEEAIEDTLMRGGDTDTNAAIVGGMVGALHGVEGMEEVEGGQQSQGGGVPRAMVERVVGRDFSKGIERPVELRPADLLALCEALFLLAPQETGPEAPVP
ncbi:unnamed protein product [Closterium sp. Naga37s-1]|nr:unnamed protein product [Closterium sp. Naga37s-1]